MTVGVLRERPTATQPGASAATGSVRVSALVGGRASAAADGRWLVKSSSCSGCDSYPCRCPFDRSERVETCVCGGRIVAVDRSDWPAIARSVGAHNATPRHRLAMSREVD